MFSNFFVIADTLTMLHGENYYVFYLNRKTIHLLLYFFGSFSVWRSDFFSYLISFGFFLNFLLSQVLITLFHFVFVILDNLMIKSRFFPPENQILFIHYSVLFFFISVTSNTHCIEWLRAYVLGVLLYNILKNNVILKCLRYYLLYIGCVIIIP